MAGAPKKVINHGGVCAVCVCVCVSLSVCLCVCVSVCVFRMEAVQTNGGSTGPVDRTTLLMDMSGGYRRCRGRRSIAEALRGASRQVKAKGR